LSSTVIIIVSGNLFGLLLETVSLDFTLRIPFGTPLGFVFFGGGTATAGGGEAFFSGDCGSSRRGGEVGGGGGVGQTGEMVGDIGGGGGGIAIGASSKPCGVPRVSGRNKAAVKAGSFTSPSANCLKAEPAPFNATTY
jgi:hypothetical protein